MTQWYLDDKPTDVVDNEITSLDGKVKVWSRTGRGGQVAGGQYPELLAAAPEWTAAHRLAGCAALYLRLTYDPDAFPGGIPNITRIVAITGSDPPGTLAAPMPPMMHITRIMTCCTRVSSTPNSCARNSTVTPS